MITDSGQRENIEKEENGQERSDGLTKSRTRKRTFVCSWSDCRRVFGKFEHLQRHERSHAGDVRYECPTCGKRFVRRDVMVRHTAIHKQAISGLKTIRKVSCISCATLKVRCDGQPGTTCRRCSSSGIACTYRNRKNMSQTHLAPSYPVNPPAVSSVNLDSAVLPNNEIPTVSSMSRTPRHENTQAINGVPLSSVAVPYNQLLRDGPADSSFAISTDTMSSFPLGLLDSFFLDSSESYLGWDSRDEELDFMRSLNADAPDTPPFNWFRGPETQDATAIQAPSFTKDPNAASHTLLPPAQLIRDAQPADTPWPHVYRPSKDDSQLDLPQVPQKSQHTLSEIDLEHVNASTRDAILSLINASNQPHWPVVDVTAFPSTQTLSICINLYFRHFHETLPILQRSTFQTTEASPVLLLAMAAIGAIYSRSGLSKLAIALNELARRAIAYLREIDRRSMFDTSIVQAWLLQSMFGLFCGSRMLYQHAEISRGGLVTAARRMHLLRPNLSFVKELERKRISAGPEELHCAYANDEERRRLGWGIYLYDMMISCLLNISPHFSIGEIDMPLPSDEDVWNSFPVGINFDPEFLQSRSPNFKHILDLLLSSGKLSQPLNPLGFSLIAHTLYRLCTDVSALDSVLPRPPTASNSPYRLSFPPSFQHNPQELLDQLSACCHSLSCMPNSLLVSVSALSHLAHIQFTWPGFLDNIKIAAGKSGTEESQNNARLWLAARIEEDPVSARAILVHSGQLNALLIRYTFDTASETVWLFDVALTFWAIVKFGRHFSGRSTTPDRTIVTWSESDDVNGWIQQGGSVSFQGLGELHDLTVARILAIFSERLENMSWGIAQRFRLVLTNLSKE